MRPPSLRRHRPHAPGRARPAAAAALACAVACAMAFGLAACSDEARDAPAGDAAELALPEETEAQLQALGYGAWSEPGDAGDLEIAGVTVFDRERAAPGLNLFKQRGRRTAVLMDLDGRVVHVWRGLEPAERADREADAPREGSDAALADHFEMGETRDRRSWHWVRALPNGDLVGIVKRLWIERLDWESNVLWSTPLATHHDIEIDGEGRILTLVEQLAEVPLPSGETATVLDNGIAIVDADDGRILERIWLLPIFGGLVTGDAPHAGDEDDSPLDVLHANTVEAVRRDVPGVARAGQVLLSLRSLNLVAVLDLAERRVVWQWGPGELDMQHQPTFLPNGNMLIFDNRPSDRASRVIELDPRTKRIVWEYRGDPPESFYTGTRGSAYPMENGNVLVAEANRGRAFEVTRAGEIVWEYWHTGIVQATKQRGTFYRFARLPPGYFEPGLLAEEPAP